MPSAWCQSAGGETQSFSKTSENTNLKPLARSLLFVVRKMADDKKEAKKEEEPKEEAKPKRSPLILIIVIINLLAVGGLGAYMVFFQGPAQAQAAAPAAAPAAPPMAPTAFGPLVEMTPLVANLNDEHIGHYIRVSMHLEVTDEETKVQVEEALVPIRNRLVIYFSELTTEQTNASGARERIRGELVEAINEVLGAPKVRRVFYTDFVVQ